ncbi:hypothetical protein ACFQ61_26525 [Streptomyces sp. NPDC056500]|uniref:hypothetical protein n=1 Tax=Streptomyces sp. NPDC056500 TaxID=3345840 RepID=UPI0036CAEFE8
MCTLLDKPRLSFTTRLYKAPDHGEDAGRSDQGHMAWFMSFVTTNTFLPFMISRVFLGIALFILVGRGALSPHTGDSGV